MNTKIGIIGSGDLADMLSHISNLLDTEVVGYFNDYLDKGQTYKNKTILGNTSEDILDHVNQGIIDKVAIAIGYNHMKFREKLFEDLQGKVQFQNLIHPHTFIDKTVKIGEAVNIFAGTVLDYNVSIGNNVLLNTGVTIAHDTSIRDGCFLGPGATLAGFIDIGVRNFIGTNATIKDNITTCEDVVLGAGSVLVKNIETAGIYMGVPASFYKSSRQ